MAKKEKEEQKTGVRGRTVIRNCNCESDYQDKKYGKGKRVCNQGAKETRCTVCGNKSA